MNESHDLDNELDYESVSMVTAASITSISEGVKELKQSIGLAYIMEQHEMMIL